MKKYTFLCSYFLFSIIISGCSSITQTSTPLSTSKASISTVISSPQLETENNFPSLEPLTIDNINQLELITTFGEGKIQSVDISPDEKYVALYKSTGVYIFNVQAKTSELLLPAYGLWHNLSNSVAFSQREDILAIAQRNFVKIYDVTKRNYIGGIADPALAGYDIREMAFSPDGKKLLVVSKASDITVHCKLMEAVQAIALYDIESGKKLFLDYACSEYPPIYKFLDNKLTIGFNDLSKEYKELLINWRTGEISPAVDTSALSMFGFIKEDDVWAVYSQDKLICKTDEKADKTVWQMGSKESNMFFLKDDGFSVSIWTISTCKKTIVIEYPFPVSSTFRFDGGALIGINGNKIVSWNIKDAKLNPLVSLEQEPFNGKYFFSRNENAVFVLTNEPATKQSRVEKINLEDGFSTNILSIPTESTTNLIISNDGSKIGVTTEYDTLQVFDSNGTFIQKYTDSDNIKTIGFSPDGSKVAFLSGDVYHFHNSDEGLQKIFLTIVEVSTGKAIGKFTVSLSPIVPISSFPWITLDSGYAIAPNWNSFTIVRNGENKEISVWDLENLKPLFKTFGQSDFYNIAYSPDSKILITTSGVGENSSFYFWSTENKTMLGSVMPFSHPYNNSYLQNVLFSPDGRLLVAQNNGVFYVWGVRAK